mgnify:CR=1 FL=1
MATTARRSHSLKSPQHWGDGGGPRSTQATSFSTSEQAYLGKKEKSENAKTNLLSTPYACNSLTYQRTNARTHKYPIPITKTRPHTTSTIPTNAITVPTTLRRVGRS